MRYLGKSECVDNICSSATDCTQAVPLSLNHMTVLPWTFWNHHVITLAEDSGLHLSTVARLSFSAVYGTTDTSFHHARHLIMRRLVIKKIGVLLFEMLMSHSIRLSWLNKKIRAVNGAVRSDEQKLLLGDSSAMASLYFTIIYSARRQIFSMQSFKSEIYRMTCLFCNCRALQLYLMQLKLSQLPSYPSNCSPRDIFYSMESFLGWRSPRNVSPLTYNGEVTKLPWPQVTDIKKIRAIQFVGTW